MDGDKKKRYLRGGQFYPYEKGGGGGIFSHAEGWGTENVGVVLTKEVDILARLKGVRVCKLLLPFERRGAQIFTLSWGVGGGDV